MDSNLIKILFVCHGNICRSPMAQSVFCDILTWSNHNKSYKIDSAATSTEEIGNPPHSGTVQKLEEVGTPLVEHYSRQVKRSEYSAWDYIIFMDDQNKQNLIRIFKEDPDNKLFHIRIFEPEAGVIDKHFKLLASTSNKHFLKKAESHAKEVADPWYTGNFDITYHQIINGCKGLLAWCESL